MAIPGVRVALIVMSLFVAVTAIGGGIALVIGLEGDRFPVAMLEATPFGSYAIPGAILAGVVGSSAGIAAVATIHGAQSGALASLLAGVVLMGWLVGEILLLKQPSTPTGIELFYFTLGSLMVGLGLLANCTGQLR